MSESSMFFPKFHILSGLWIAFFYRNCHLLYKCIKKPQFFFFHITAANSPVKVRNTEVMDNDQLIICMDSEKYFLRRNQTDDFLLAMEVINNIIM